MAKLERKQELLTPKTDKTGTKAIKRNTVDVEKMEVAIDPTIQEQKQKSRMRLIVIFGILDLALLGYVVYEVVTIFSTIINAGAGNV